MNDGEQTGRRGNGVSESPFAYRCPQRKIGYDPTERGIWSSFRASCPACGREVTVGANGLVAVHRRPCRARSWQLDGHAICGKPAGHRGNHGWEIQ